MLFFVLFCTIAALGLSTFVAIDLHFKRKQVKLDDALAARVRNWIDNV